MRGMFVTGPPSSVDGTSLRVCGAASRTFDDLTGQVLNPTMRGYVHDMAVPYGLAVREDLIDRGVGHSYGEMCTPLLDELVPEDRPADLLVLATAIPDVRYGRSTATYLGWHCAGTPLAFTVCDQGLLAAFTALHLVAAYTRTGTCLRAVLLVAEQPTLYHELPVPTPIPDRAAAVGVVVEADGSRGGLSVRRHTKIAERDVPEVLASHLPGSGTAIVGTGLAEVLADRPVDGNVLVCQENQPLTGIWSELSQRLSGWQGSGEQVVLADFDPALGYLFSATLSFGG